MFFCSLSLSALPRQTHNISDIFIMDTWKNNYSVIPTSNTTINIF